ncbi:MAG: VWA domain-containing protein, partial [Acidobacteriia bacterium]|nr:VWA domain-containing protein [Terriglobia bacterium]
MKIIRLFLAGLILLPQTQVGVQAQQPPPKQEQQKPDEDLGDPIRVDVDVVNVYCSVRNKQNNIVINLNKDDFDLAEDGQKQNIKYFTRETDIPLTIGLLIDVSGSQINLIEQERRAGGQFFSSVLRKKDMAFLIQFGAESELLQDMTGTPRLLQDGLRRLKPNTGMSGIHPGPVPTMSKQRGTVLFDAVYVASKDMLANEVGRKAIVIITDGEDFGSTESERTAIEAAQKSDAIIYGILYADRQFYGSMNLGS